MPKQKPKKKLKKTEIDPIVELCELLKIAKIKVWFHKPDCAIWKSVGGSHKCDKNCKGK